jgi:hypothetical protein
VIAQGETAAAVARAAALRTFPILGVRTNIAFLINASSTRRFAPAICTPGSSTTSAGIAETPPPSEIVVAAAAFARRAGTAESGGTSSVNNDRGRCSRDGAVVSPTSSSRAARPTAS